MKKEEFDGYRYTVNTEINYFEDVWDRVTEVDFENRTFGVERGQVVECKYVKGIRQFLPLPEALIDR